MSVAEPRAAPPASIPSDYVPGHREARLLDADLADRYVRHTMIGDPLADAVMEYLNTLSGDEAHRLIEAGMDGDPSGLAGTPGEFREFFAQLDSPPAWVDPTSFGPGIRMFHRNSRVILVGFVGGVLIEGFATNISRSFFITGRLRDQGVRRLQQNNRHMIECFLPGGLDREGDGLKLSVRVRLIHAQIRRLLNHSGDWDHEAWGMPLSAAHMGYSITAFSTRLLGHMRALGASFDAEERGSFMAVWRYVGYLMGIPETILFQDEQQARRVFKYGGMCEPPVSLEGIAMANSLINSAPYVAGIPDIHARHRLARYAYRLSRGLIGDELADQLRYPSGAGRRTLMHFRNMGRLRQWMGDHFPKFFNNSYTHFSELLGVSAYDEEGISYRIPDNVYAEESTFY